MKKLEHAEHRHEHRILRKFSTLAAAAAILTSGCAGTNVQVRPAIVQPSEIWPSSYLVDDRRASVGHASTVILRLSKPFDTLLRESDGYTVRDETLHRTIEGRNVDVYEHWTGINARAYGVGDNIVNYPVVIFFNIYPAPVRRFEIGVHFPEEMDYANGGPDHVRGIRTFSLDRIRDDLDPQITSVKIIVEVGSTYLTAHAIPYDGNGRRVGNFPDGQLALGITFVPTTRRADAGLSILQNP